MVDFRMPDVVGTRARRLRKRLFERLVVRALDGLPADVRAMLDNVEIVVEDEPSADHLADGDNDHEGLFGLYQGVPLTERDSGYSMVLPDKITLFRGPLERACANSAELMEQVRITVVHEVSHHIGLDEDRIDALGWA